MHAQSASLNTLNETAKKELAAVKRDFVQGAKVAKSLVADLNDVQRRINACQKLAKEKFPVAYGETWGELAMGAEDDDD